MSEQNGTTNTTKAYNPHDHLIKIKTRNGEVDYLPAAWRLYELNLRYEEANFSTEIVHMDIERNFVIVKCRLYLGADYEMSHRKTEAMKQGLLSQLDKIETAAKARCARDLGISTELALDWDEADILEPVDTTNAPTEQPAPIRETLQASLSGKNSTKQQSNGHASNRVEVVQKLFASVYHAEPEHLANQWALFVESVLGRTIADSELTEEKVARLHGAIIAAQREQAQQAKQQSNGHKPAMTAATVQAWFAKVYKVAPTDLSTRWLKFKKYILTEKVADEQLTEDQLDKLNGAVSQQYQKVVAAREQAAEQRKATAERKAS